jgi:hypothetical protein
MTDKQFKKQISTALNAWATRMMKKFHRDVAEMGEDAARAQWREEHGLIYVKQYTVAARFRANPYRNAKLSTEAKKALEEQAKFWKEQRERSKRAKATQHTHSNRMH